MKRTPTRSLVLLFHPKLAAAGTLPSRSRTSGPSRAGSGSPTAASVSSAAVKERGPIDVIPDFFFRFGILSSGSRLSQSFWLVFLSDSVAPFHHLLSPGSVRARLHTLLWLLAIFLTKKGEDLGFLEVGRAGTTRRIQPSLMALELTSCP